MSGWLSYLERSLLRGEGGFGIVYIGTIYYAWQELVLRGANGFAFLGSSQHHLENTWQGAVLWAEAISICLHVCQRGRLKGACFDDFTMSVLHLSLYSNRARHELYISLGLSMAHLVDFSSV